MPRPVHRAPLAAPRLKTVFVNAAGVDRLAPFDWLPAAVLPLTKQVITSQVFMDRYVTNGEVITHSHGPQGMHSHGPIDFNTWMDPQQAAMQAQSVHDELVRLVPAAAKEFDHRFADCDDAEFLLAHVIFPRRISDSPRSNRQNGGRNALWQL